MKDEHTTETERAKYRRMWGQEIYRRNSPGLNIAPRVFELMGMRAGESLTDYGCGEGKAMDWFRGQGLEVRGVDLVALRPGVVEASLWELPEELGSSDWAFCADVMEHLPRERVREVLVGIRERTRRGAAFTVATIPCTVGKRFGEVLHLTVEPVEWWQEMMEGVWDRVERHDTDRTWRPLFVVEGV